MRSGYLATFLTVSLLFSGCGGTPLYIAKREYLVINNSGPSSRSTPDIWLTIEEPSTTGRPTTKVFGSGRDCAIFGRSDITKCWFDDPAWSPDGARFAVVARPQSELAAPMQIYIAEWNGSQARSGVRINKAPARNPAWSPDGKSIAFESNGDIWVADTCQLGDEPLQVTTNPADDSDPTWSRDGKWIAFVSDRSGNDDIWAVGTAIASPTTGAGGTRTFGAPVNWTATTDTDENLPYFSEIGPRRNTSQGIDQLMFQRDQDLWWLPVPAAGSQPTRITSDGVEKLYAEYNLNNLMVAYITDGTGAGQIFEVAVSAGNVQRAIGSTSWGKFSSRQEWTGTRSACP
jgi:dipeptidyl aminopeptidase/acylaminoacyl peptidase